MARPPQLVLIMIVYWLGAAIAATHGESFHSQRFVIGLVVVLVGSASVHHANEYADAETDELTTRTPFSGGSGALPETGLSPNVALAAGTVSLTATALLVILYWQALPSIAFVVLAIGIALGWQYSVGPLRLAWRGFGELDNAILGGMLLPLYGYVVQTSSLTIEVVLALVPFTAIVFVNLLDTTWPDRTADAAVGKNTLATRWSARRLRTLYTYCTCGFRRRCR
ncbi:prenyltransferase [Haladaptatus caseinilyticus]|uniref:prenyltransferase n=1 Tax=Haladaptatus caseinilyticus TaxID=2993314 RepID=UPI00224A9F47|nr:prenyltransferase [Haladaptatus caseinilyticus]